MTVPRVVRILERLARQPTAPFHEHRVAGEAAKIAETFGGSVRRDRFGNLIVAPPGSRPGPPIWLIAHMDHPGLEVVARNEARLNGGIRAGHPRRGGPVPFYHGRQPI